MKDKLLELLQKRQGMSVPLIHRELGINPANEEDRVKVWRVGQGLAELYYRGFIKLEVASGVRYAIHNAA